MMLDALIRRLDALAVDDRHNIHRVVRLALHDASKAISDLRRAETRDIDELVVLMLAELHANVPEADRPMSLMDLSDEQADRARRAVRAVILGAPSKPAGHWPNLATLEAALASADTHPTGGDSTEIESPASLSGAVPEGQTPSPSPSPAAGR